jgi:hypothetical protein
MTELVEQGYKEVPAELLFEDMFWFLALPKEEKKCGAFFSVLVCACAPQV